jgi:xylulokinase
LAAGLSFRWFRNNLGDCGSDYDSLVNEAAKIPAVPMGAIWLPYLMGERAPYLDPKRAAAFVGLTAEPYKAALARAVLEGFASAFEIHLRSCRELRAPIETIDRRRRSNVALWRQIQADVYGHAVETIAVDQVQRSVARILAGVGAGAWSSV